MNHGAFVMRTPGGWCYRASPPFSLQKNFTNKHFDNIFIFRLNNNRIVRVGTVIIFSKERKVEGTPRTGIFGAGPVTAAVGKAQRLVLPLPVTSLRTSHGLLDTSHQRDAPPFDKSRTVRVGGQCDPDAEDYRPMLFFDPHTGLLRNWGP